MRMPTSGPADRRGLLVLGLGNVLCSDDGVGPAAIARLRRDHAAPEDAAVLDGGTLGLGLLPWLETARDVILVDAVREPAPPGTLVELEGGDVPAAVLERLSAHQVGVADLLGGAQWRGRAPERLLLLGVVPLTLATGLGLSSPVRAALPALVERVVAAAGRMGYTFCDAAGHATDVAGDGDLRLARVLGL
jgi:hydrogenase maturation protease